MSLRLYLFLMTIGTLLAYAAWGFVILNLSPLDENLVGLLAFYLSLFMAILGTFSVTGFMARRLFSHSDEVVFRDVKRTFRHSLLLSTAIIVVLVLLSKNLLFWWNSIILVTFFVFVEIIIFSNSKRGDGNYV